ncbi:RNA polymerase sigma factor (sigma-70 family) [Arthrobacter sp. GAS37]|uniref:sigma-70 family RNA polymerase sigma factor n=1 Tax=Arthrobacter sp. GAS37 TaxID=3156261 RepID=UPI003833FEFB
MEQDLRPAHPSADSAPGKTKETDLQLIAKARSGDEDAFAVLYERHRGAAVYVADRQTDNASDRDDVVADAFTSVFQNLTAGKGPDQFFRAYLLTVVRRTAHERNRQGQRTLLTHDESQLDSIVLDEDTVLTEFESTTMAKAFKSLPERWQAVLWHVDIEGMKPAAAAPLVGLTPNAVSSLLIRAREGLRRSYLNNHVSTSPQDPCSEFATQLGSFVRDGLKRTSKERVQAHLDGCAKCTNTLAEITDIQSGLRAAVFPLIAGILFTPEIIKAFAGQGSGTAPTNPRPKNTAKGTALAALIAALAVAAAVLVNQIVHPGLSSNPAGPEPGPVASQAVAAPTLSPSNPPSPVPAPAVPDSPTPEIQAPGAPAAGTPRPAAGTPLTVVDSGTVSSLPRVQGSTAQPTPARLVDAVLSTAPGTTPSQMNLTVDFTLSGDAAVSTAETAFTLDPEDSFLPVAIAAPSGWSCPVPPPNSRSLTCRTTMINPRNLGFSFGITTTSATANHTLTYQMSGQNILEKTFASGFVWSTRQ